MTNEQRARELHPIVSWCQDRDCNGCMYIAAALDAAFNEGWTLGGAAMRGVIELDSDSARRLYAEGRQAGLEEAAPIVAVLYEMMGTDPPHCYDEHPECNSAWKRRWDNANEALKQWRVLKTAKRGEGTK